jgi:hypothetical protein
LAVVLSSLGLVLWSSACDFQFDCLHFVEFDFMHPQSASSTASSKASSKALFCPPSLAAAPQVEATYLLL